MVTFEDDVVRMEEFKNRIKRTLIIKNDSVLDNNEHASSVSVWSVDLIKQFSSIMLS